MKRHLFMNRWRYLLTIYVVMALLTFGRCVGRTDLANYKQDQAYAACVEAASEHDTCTAPVHWKADTIGNSLLGGLGWPIYWSWVLADKAAGVPDVS